MVAKNDFGEDETSATLVVTEKVSSCLIPLISCTYVLFLILHIQIWTLITFIQLKKKDETEEESEEEEEEEESEVESQVHIHIKYNRRWCLITQIHMHSVTATLY